MGLEQGQKMLIFVCYYSSSGEHSGPKVTLRPKFTRVKGHDETTKRLRPLCIEPNSFFVRNETCEHDGPKAEMHGQKKILLVFEVSVRAFFVQAKLRRQQHEAVDNPRASAAVIEKTSCQSRGIFYALGQQQQACLQFASYYNPT